MFLTHPAETSDITTAHATTNALVNAVPTVVEIDTRLSTTHGSGQWDATASGPGGTECTYNVEVGGSPEQGVAVWVTTDEAGTNVIAGATITDSAGNVTFMLDEGILYYIWCRKDAVNFSNPYTKTW